MAHKLVNLGLEGCNDVNPVKHGATLRDVYIKCRRYEVIKIEICVGVWELNALENAKINLVNKCCKEVFESNVLGMWLVTLINVNVSYNVPNDVY